MATIEEKIKGKQYSSPATAAAGVKRSNLTPVEKRRMLQLIEDTWTDKPDGGVVSVNTKAKAKPIPELDTIVLKMLYVAVKHRLSMDEVFDARERPLRRGPRAAARRGAGLMNEPDFLDYEPSRVRLEDMGEPFDPGQLNSATSWHKVEGVPSGANILRIGDRLVPPRRRTIASARRRLQQGHGLGMVMLCALGQMHEARDFEPPGMSLAQLRRLNLEQTP